MANIQPYIDDILAAVYGEQVRNSIADAILAINDAAITSVVLGSDNKLVITFQDGHTYTSGSLKGAKGDKGDTGQTGATGATGATGNGIASITLQSTVGTAKTYRITYTNGSHFDFVVNDGEVSAADLQQVADRVGTMEGEVGNINAHLGFLGNNDVVGIQVDYENKTFTRLASAAGKTAGADFDSLTPFGGRRRCNVANDGTINAYYGDEGYTEDGSNGQVMVYQPKFYYLVTPIKFDKNTAGLGYHLRKANYYVSSNKYTGFKLHPAFYDGNGNEVDYILLSAYEGSMWDASQNKYINDSVDESIAYADGDLLCSVAGKKPISGLRTGMGTKANYEAMSNNRGAGWHLETIKATSANQLLMIIELGMMNTQTGIGQGVVSITDNSSYNCSSLTGSTGSLGNGTGSAASTINEKGGVETTETASGKVSITYRGVENPWGNIYKHIQGVNIWGDGSMAGGQPFVCDDLSSFNESSHSGHYEGAGFAIPNASGYIKAMGYGNPDFDWLLMPSEIGGDSSLPVGDYCYVTADLNGYRIARLGGDWNDGAKAGGFFWDCIYGVGSRRRTFGGRLLYVPTAPTV